MNNSVKIEKLLEELQDNIAVAGEPETDYSDEGFSIVCEYVTEWMIRKYDLDTDADINWGYCFIWAYLVWAVWPYGGVTFRTTTGHVVVEFNKHFYDSEHIDGRPVLDSEFTCFGKHSNNKHLDINWMAWFWSRSGKQLREFRRLLRKCNPQVYRFARENGKNHWVNSQEFFYYYGEIDKIPQIKA